MCRQDIKDGINIKIGVNNVDTPILLSLDDDCVHTAVGGRIGSGKTTLIRNAILASHIGVTATVSDKFK